MAWIPFVVMSVCQATGQPWPLAWRASWAMTLFAYRTLRDAERLQDFRDADRRIADAHRVAVAFHDPQKLQQEVVALRRRIRASPNFDRDTDRRETEREKAAMTEHFRRLDEFAAQNAERFPLTEG